VLDEWKRKCLERSFFMTQKKVTGPLTSGLQDLYVDKPETAGDIGDKAITSSSFFKI